MEKHQLEDFKGNKNLEISNEVNYWNKPMESIIWGYIFTMITFNFLGVQYILPILGTGLLYIGFRGIRKENKQLNNAWIFAKLNIILQIFNLICVSTPLNNKIQNSLLFILLVGGFQVGFLLMFRSGLKKVFEKENIKTKRDPILWLVILKLIFIAGVIGIEIVSIVIIPLIIWGVYIFYSLYKVKGKLSSIKGVSEYLKFKNNRFILGYGIACILVVGICCIFANNIKLDGKKFVEQSMTKEREVLISKGFPKEILKEMSNEDVQQLKNPMKIEVSNGTLKYSGEFIESEIKATNIYIELKDNQMYGVQYFEWEKGGAYWSDKFTLSGSNDLELISGKLLYEKENKEYTAPIPKLKMMNINTDFLGTENNEEVIGGTVNYPFNSNNQRGYIFYKINTNPGTIRGTSIFNYFHYKTPFRIPYVEEEGNIMFNDKLQQYLSGFEREVYTK